MSNKEPLNIVILGASFAGLAVAHKFLRKTIEEIGVTRSASRYRVVLVGPSTHLYWNIGAPRALVSGKLLPTEKVFVPFLELFEEYSKTRFTYIQGHAHSVDFLHRNITIALAGELIEKNQVNARWSHSTGHTESTFEKQGAEPQLRNTQTFPFHALVIATGTSAKSPLLSLHGDHEQTFNALIKFHANLEQASSIIVAGGGPSGIECAGQLATFLNRGKKPTPPSKSPTTATFSDEKKPLRSWSRILSRIKPTNHPTTSNAPTQPPAPATRKTIMLISGHDRLLPRLGPAFGLQAEAQLKKLGVTIIHNMRVEDVETMPSGSTKCILSGIHGDVMFCDAYIAATGVQPNTSFLPSSLLDASGYVNADPLYLRVPGAGARVYALGDCASHTKNSIQDVYDSIPILLQNLKNDLLTYELEQQYPHGGAGSRLEKLEDWAYIQNPTDSQLMPVSRFGGVGILFGMKLPSFIVWLMKGRDYRIGRAKLAAGVGKDPYAVV